MSESGAGDEVEDVCGEGRRLSGCWALKQSILGGRKITKNQSC